MRIKLDENLSRHLKEAVQSLGHDVSTAKDEGLLGKPDTEVGAAARTEERLLFTLDVEFADLRKYPPGKHPGVVLFRPRTVGALTVNRFVVDFVAVTDLTRIAGCVVVVEHDKMRIRRPPAP